MKIDERWGGVDFAFERDRTVFVTLTGVPVSRVHQARAFPSVLRHHYRAVRRKYSRWLSVCLCWRLAGMHLRIF